MNASSHFDKATDALLRFVQTGKFHIPFRAFQSDLVLEGMPCIDAAQNRVSSMMLNASTVATFFAGVTGKIIYILC